MAKKRRRKARKIKLKKTEMLSNENAMERIKGKIICIMPEPPLIIYNNDEEGEIVYPETMLVLVKEDGKYKLFTIPNENFKNAVVSENVPKKFIKMMKDLEKEKSKNLMNIWCDESVCLIKEKRQNRNFMYV